MDILKTTTRRFKQLLVLLASLTAIAAHAEDNGPTRAQQMKAVCIYKFIRYIHWPENTDHSAPDAGTSICIVGKDPYDGALQALQNQTNVSVRQANNSNQVTDCHMLVIGESEHTTVDQVLQDLRGKSIATISEIDRFTDLGGMIRLYGKNNRIAFDINKSAAQNAQLRIDLRLIRLSAAVVE